MCRHLGPMKSLLFLGATLVSASTVWAEDAKSKSGKDPAGTTLIMGQLRLMFEVWDRNKDGYLDPGELAKAFRGGNARPHNGDGRTPSDKLAAKYPDYQFLIELDQNHDGKISLREFEDWARSYAKELKSSSKSSSARSSSGQKSSSSSATKTDPSTQNATKTEQQIAKDMVANQKQQLHYLQEIEKQLKQMKHGKH
jgi:Ca2+-binding EF-hand superfamily protein